MRIKFGAFVEVILGFASQIKNSCLAPYCPKLTIIIVFLIDKNAQKAKFHFN